MLIFRKDRYTHLLLIQNFVSNILRGSIPFLNWFFSIVFKYYFNNIWPMLGVYLVQSYASCYGPQSSGYFESDGVLGVVDWRSSANRRTKFQPISPKNGRLSYKQELDGSLCYLKPSLKFA